MSRASGRSLASRIAGPSLLLRVRGGRRRWDGNLSKSVTRTNWWAGSPGAVMHGGLAWATLAALLLAVISVGGSLGAIDFPFGTLGDVYAKVQAITTGRTNYFHPLLMIELAQGASLIVQPRDSQSLVEVGLCAALAGGLLVFATFRLARLVLPDLAALAAAAVTAATPLVTVCMPASSRRTSFSRRSSCWRLPRWSDCCRRRRRGARSFSACSSVLPPARNISAR